MIADVSQKINGVVGLICKEIKALDITNFDEIELSVDKKLH